MRKKRKFNIGKRSLQQEGSKRGRGCKAGNYRYAGPIPLARDSAKKIAGYIYFFCPDTPYGAAVGVQEY